MQSNFYRSKKVTRVLALTILTVGFCGGGSVSAISHPMRVAQEQDNQSSNDPNATSSGASVDQKSIQISPDVKPTTESDEERAERIKSCGNDPKCNVKTVPNAGIAGGVRG